MPDEAAEVARRAALILAALKLKGWTRIRLAKATGYDERTVRNVIGVLPGSDQARASEAVVIGAHYDHLGHGENGSSLADKSEIGRIHFGADDNASGSAAVLGVGEILSRQPRARNVLLEFWSGEELGLIGSSAYVNAPVVALDQLQPAIVARDRAIA